MNISKKVSSTLKRTPYIKPTAAFMILFIVAGALVYYIEVGKNPHFDSFIDGFWWAIITFSTTGYGDKYPITLGGRIIAVSEK